jgi:hypothetical protein
MTSELALARPAQGAQLVEDVRLEARSSRSPASPRARFEADRLDDPR